MRYHPRSIVVPPRASPTMLPRIDDLFDRLPAGVVIHGPRGRIVSANQLACRLLGHSHIELIGAESTANVWHFVDDDGTPIPPSEFPVNRVLRSLEALSDQVVGVPGLPDGKVRWLLCNAYPEFDDKDELMHVVVCFTDCTALKYAEQSMQQAEERLRLVLQGSTDAPWDWNLLTDEAYYSDRWREMLGHPPGPQTGDGGFWIRMAHPDDQARLAAFIPDLLAGHDQKFAIEFRLRHRDGHDVPVLARGYVLRDAQGKAVRMSGTNTDLSERRKTEQHIYDLAYLDHLTGLPNRRLLLEKLEQVLRCSRASGRFGALLFIDLDNFKLLNDTLGHDSGDQLLRQVADRLRSVAPDQRLLSRFGGDEFVLALEDLGQTAAQASARAAETSRVILQLLAKPHALPGKMCFSTPSIGIAVFGGGIDQVDALLKHADLAMYRAKADGRNTMRLFDPAMLADAEREASLQESLRLALAQDQFVLYCQPQFDRAGQLCGAEVLVRWQHPERGIVAPNEFIGLAEKSGLIVPLGQYVLEESCRALARWAGDPVLGALKLSVNVSVHQLRESDFAQTVAKVLTLTQARAGRLWLELTESVFAENPEALIERMQALRDQGVQLALDDFGTGYSSLSYLQRFPLTALKIDRVFTHELLASPSGTPVIDAIVVLARKLGLQIIAEGVEYEVQRDYLLDCGCDALQGYLLGKPMPLASFENLYGKRATGAKNQP